MKKKSGITMLQRQIYFKVKIVKLDKIGCYVSIKDNNTHY